MKTDTLDKNITRFVRRFGIKRAIMANENCYNIYNNTIYYTIFDDGTANHWIEFLYKTYNINISEWYFIFVLLHEIGHYMTLDKIDIELESSLRNLIDCVESPQAQNELYFSLHAEDLANKWAIEYLNNHKEECRKLQNKYYAIMYHIAKKNKLF